MAFLHDDILDAALSYISTNNEYLYICNAAPTTFAQASQTPGSSGYSLGYKAAPSFGSIANGDVSGRKLPVTAISDGSVNYTGTASHWALTDNSASKLLTWGTLSSSQSVTNGNTFTLTTFDIEFPDPA